MTEGPRLVLGTAVLLGPRAVLIRGPSGSGKSSLAMALLARAGPAAPAVLVADDAVHARSHGRHVIVTPPPATRGLIEIRGVGLRAVPFVERAVLGLVADLSVEGERLPEDGGCLTSICGVDVPRVAVDPHGAAVVDTLAAVVRAILEGRAPPILDPVTEG